MLLLHTVSLASLRIREVRLFVCQSIPEYYYTERYSGNTGVILKDKIFRSKHVLKMLVVYNHRLLFHEPSLTLSV